MESQKIKQAKVVFRSFLVAGGVLLCLLLFVLKIEEISEWIIAKKESFFSRLPVSAKLSNVNFDDFEPLTDEANAWYLEDNLMVAHACGGIDAIRYTNSREALETAIEHGFTLIEADFILTEDEKVVLRHGFSHDLEQDDYVEPGTVLSAKQHSEIPVFHKYHALSFSEFKEYMVEHPELRLVVDCYTPRVLELMVEECCADRQEALLDRFLVQFYNPEDHEVRKKIYPFRNWIFTLYQTDMDLYSAAQYCLEQNVHVLAVPFSRLNVVSEDQLSVLKEKNLHLMTYTLNSIRECRQYYQKGVGGFYTDFLVPDDMTYIRREQ